MMNTGLGTRGWGLKSSGTLSLVCILKAGLGAEGWGLKSSPTHCSMRTRISNFKKIFPHCKLLAPSPQPPVPAVELLAPNPKPQAPCNKPQLELYA